MSRTHANRGKIWERQLDRLHALWASSGRAVVHRNHPEVVVRRDRRTGKVIGADHRQQGAPDYTILSRGRFIVADAKSTRERRWAFRLLEPHQANALDAIESQGGLGLLLVNTPAGSWALPWRAVRPLWGRWYAGEAGRGEASLTAAQMTALCLCHAPKGRTLDYLEPSLECLAGRREVA